jgi:hypothetical protein
MPPTSFTLGHGRHQQVLRQKMLEAADFQIIKIKLGADRRPGNHSAPFAKFPSKPIYADANQGWKNREEALDLGPLAGRTKRTTD